MGRKWVLFMSAYLPVGRPDADSGSSGAHSMGARGFLLMGPNESRCAPWHDITRNGEGKTRRKPSAKKQMRHGRRLRGRRDSVAGSVGPGVTGETSWDAELCGTKYCGDPDRSSWQPEGGRANGGGLPAQLAGGLMAITVAEKACYENSGNGRG